MMGIKERCFAPLINVSVEELGRLLSRPEVSVKRAILAKSQATIETEPHRRRLQCTDPVAPSARL